MQITCAYWVKDETEARLIVREVHAEPRSWRRWPAGSHRQDRAAQGRERRRAHGHRAHRARHRAAACAHRRLPTSSSRSTQAQAAGELSWFNSAYRAWRLEAKQVGRGMSYAEARARLRKNLFRQILSNEVQTGPYQIFPPLPGIDFPVSG